MVAGRPAHRLDARRRQLVFATPFCCYVPKYHQGAFWHPHRPFTIHIQGSMSIKRVLPNLLLALHAGAEWLDAKGNVLAACARPDGRAWVLLSPAAGVLEYPAHGLAEAAPEDAMGEDDAGGLLPSSALQPAARTGTGSAGARWVSPLLHTCKGASTNACIQCGPQHHDEGMDDALQVRPPPHPLGKLLCRRMCLRCSRMHARPATCRRPHMRGSKRRARLPGRAPPTPSRNTAPGEVPVQHRGFTSPAVMWGSLCSWDAAVDKHAALIRDAACRDRQQSSSYCYWHMLCLCFCWSFPVKSFVRGLVKNLSRNPLSCA